MFLVQIGKGPKGKYKTKYQLDQEPIAWFWYSGLNINGPFKARIVRSDNGEVIARKSEWW